MYLRIKNVYAHQINPRSKAHIVQVKTYLERFFYSLKSAKIDVTRLLIRNVSQKHVGIFHSYVSKEYSGFANRTYNRHFDTVSELFQYLIEVKQYTLINYFTPKFAVHRPWT